MKTCSYFNRLWIKFLISIKFNGVQILLRITVFNIIFNRHSRHEDYFKYILLHLQFFKKKNNLTKLLFLNIRYVITYIYISLRTGAASTLSWSSWYLSNLSKINWGHLRGVFHQQKLLVCHLNKKKQIEAFLRFCE